VQPDACRDEAGAETRQIGDEPREQCTRGGEDILGWRHDVTVSPLQC
jgi:hypothetical protein